MPLRQAISPEPRNGFLPLGDLHSHDSRFGNNNMMQHSEEIPMTKVRTHNSTNWNSNPNGEDSMYKQETRKEAPLNDSPQGGMAGRRKLAKVNSRGEHEHHKDAHLTTMGRFYNKFVGFSVVTRYLVYVVPVAGVLAIPIALGATTATETRIAGMRLLWFFLWIELVWLSIWISKLFAQFLPYAFVFVSGVVSPGTRKYALILRNVEIPLSLVGWAVACNATFKVLSERSDNITQGWYGIMQKILGAALVASLIYLAEKMIIQLISISYHQRSFDGRIAESKRNIFLLGLLYEASRSLFPMYCKEFEDEDHLIAASFEGRVGAKSKSKKQGQQSTKRSGSATPMRLLNGAIRVGDNITSAFGNIASEITGKQVFNPNSAHSIVIEALEKKKSSEALARRIWMSFVVEGAEGLTLEDIREVLGPARRDEADEAFYSIDVDGNRDISLDEMIMKIVDMSRERKAIAKSMHDIGGAISVLDSVLATVASVIVVFIFVAFLNASFVTTLATAGTTLLSLSFVFAVTCQEFLGSCIFLFIKHPYDVGDRVDIKGPESEQLVVTQISLLYTVFKRIDYMKMVQVPNIVLNTMWIENVTRSSAMKEQFELSISFDTSLEDVELLRAEMEAFVQHPDNSRDYQPEVIMECAGVGTMDKMVLKTEIRHKSNWSNETVRASRRSKFFCALVLALRKIPIYGPGGGGNDLGGPANPTYSVAVTDEWSAAARKKADEGKEAKRMIPTQKDEPVDVGGDSEKSGVLATGAEHKAMGEMTRHGAADDAGRDHSSGSTLGDEHDTELERKRSNDIERLRTDLVKRQSTRGKRRAEIPSLTTSGLSTESAEGVTVGKRQFQGVMSPGAAARIDEEAELGGWETSYGQPASNPAPSYGAAHPGAQQRSNPYSNAAPQVQGGNTMLQQQQGNSQQGQSLSGGAYNDFSTNNQGYGGPQQHGAVPPRKEMGGGGR